MNDNRLCNKCGLLPQTGAKPQPPCKPKCACKPKCRKDCCGEGFVFRKITIPAALGDDKTGEMVPRNGLYCNALVSYEASSVQYMYDSYGVPSKVASFDFKDMTNVPTYDGVPLNYISRIPSVEKAVSEEARIREQADDNLQEQIDAIAAGSATTTPGAYDINFPNTWPENTEIYFGNGMYGQRFTGTITAAKNTPDNTIIMTGLQNGSIINWGGNWIDADGNQMGAGSYKGDTVQSLVQLNKTNLNGQLFFSTNDNTGARTNAPYDVWVTYSR